MNIIEFCLSPASGGLEIYAYQTVRELTKSHRVFTLVSNQRKRNLTREYLLADGVPFTEISLRFFPLPLFTAHTVAGMIDREAIDVLHVHRREDLPLVALAKRFSRRRPRLIFTCQMKISHSKRDPYHDFVYGQVDLLLTITDQLQEMYAERLSPRNRERIRTLYYGVAPPERVLTAAEAAELRSRNGIEPNAFLVGLFGRVEQGKGQHLFIEALGKLKQAGQSFRALVVGNAPQQAYLAGLKDRARVLGIGEAVIFLDFLRNPQEMMQTCDCIVLTTYGETFGRVLIEAMSLAKPVIGSNRDGVLEIIDDGVNGLLFKSGDHDSLFGKLLEIARNPEQSRAMGEAGRKKARVVFSLENHYRELQRLMTGAEPN